MSRADFNKQSRGVRKDGSVGIQDTGFDPMLTAFAANDAALEPNGCAGGDGALVIDLHVARHGDDVVGTDCLAHGLVEQRRDDATMDVTARAFKGVGYRREADDGAVFREQKFEVQPGRICLAAAKATVLRRVGQGCQVFKARFHRLPTRYIFISDDSR
jgi:hypothetical protein